MQSRENEHGEIEHRTLIIGYGNPLRGDDGGGWVAAERLEKDLGPARAEVLICHQLLPEFAEPISRATRVIFIDAAADDAPGHVRRRTVLPDDTAAHVMMHEVSPEGLLSMAVNFYGYSPPADVFTIGGEIWDHCEGLSPKVAAAVDKVVADVEHLVEEIGHA